MLRSDQRLSSVLYGRFCGDHGWPDLGVRRGFAVDPVPTVARIGSRAANASEVLGGVDSVGEKYNECLPECFIVRQRAGNRRPHCLLSRIAMA